MVAMRLEEVNGDELALNEVTPPNEAVMLCAPAASVVVVNVAMLPTKAAVPSVVAPSLNVTVPLVGT